MRHISQPFRIIRYGQATNGIVFVFAGWRTTRWPYRRGIRYLNSIGYQCLLFVPNSKLIAIGTPYSELNRAGESASERVSNEINSLINTTPTATFMTIGVSMGTGFATRVAREQPLIKRIVLLAPFGSFADHFEDWQYHPYFKRVIKSQPTTKAGSIAVLNAFGNERDLKRLQDKKILVGYSTADKTISTKVIEQYIKKLQAHNLDVRIEVAKGSHLRGIVKNSRKISGSQRDFFDPPVL